MTSSRAFCWSLFFFNDKLRADELRYHLLQVRKYDLSCSSCDYHPRAEEEKHTDSLRA